MGFTIAAICEVRKRSPLSDTCFGGLAVFTGIRAYPKKYWISRWNRASRDWMRPEASHAGRLEAVRKNRRRNRSVVDHR